ncbi:cell wall metabolism sensor histidine kinase WalK [Cellulosimicrobium sp. 72-3]|uniref:sensor histidine kinase n=1 Tax=Cellulosimicrobium sp. 72-3 TaxID=2731680 RepID=UPI00148EAE9A|nr:ATP-binding protein [Cellulosimicrobium sp. 72-3]
MSRPTELGERYPVLRLGWADEDAVALRQVPITLSVVVAAASLWWMVEPARPGLLVAAVVLSVGVLVVAALGRWDTWPVSWRFACSLAQMLAIGLLDVGAGLQAVTLDILLVLPLASLALRPGSAGPAVGLAGAGLVLLVPVVVDTGRIQPVLHAVVTFSILATLALGIHGIVTLARGQAVQLAAARDALDASSRRLRDSRDTLASILAAATEQAFLATDDAGTVVSANTGAERLLGTAASTLVGTDVVRLLGGGSAAAGEAGDQEGGTPSALAEIVGAAAHGGTEVHERDHTLPDGTSRRLEVVVTRRPALSGPAPELPPGYLFVATDVTRRHEDEQEQDAFIGLVSHELRTPLASILGYVDLLRMRPESLDDEQQRYLQVVERNAHQLQALVEDLLTSAQVVSGTFALVPMELDVVEVVREAVASTAPVAARAGVAIVEDGDAEVRLLSDAQRLGQVVENLLTNAVKHSTRGGQVRVSVTAEPAQDAARCVRVRVVDHGTGIPADELARLTERFYRTRETVRRRVRGVGLGLSLVQTIVDAHGGSLSIASEPGVGTEVDVLLPDLSPDQDEP